MLPYLGSVRRLPAAHAPAADRKLLAHHPVHGVDAVDGLFDDVIAREPAIVVPVADLVLHLRTTLLVGLPRIPDALGIVGRFNGHNLADLAVKDLLHRLAPGCVVAPAEAVDQRQVLGLGVLASLDKSAQAGPVDRHRLFDEAVDALLDGIGQMHGAEMGRRGQDHQIHLVDHLLVGVEAAILAILGNIDPRPDARAFECGQAVLEPIGKDIAHGDQPGAAIRRERLFGCSRADGRHNRPDRP